MSTVYPFLYRELEGISLDELAEIVDCPSDWRNHYDGMLSGRYGYPTDLIAHEFCRRKTIGSYLLNLKVEQTF